MMQRITCVLILASVLVANVSAQLENRVKAQRLLDSLLSGEYDRRVRPTPVNETASSDKPVTDAVNMFIRSIESVDTEKMTMTVQLTFRQQWNDARLSYNHPQTSFLVLDDPSRIWQPDLFFSNGLSGHRHVLMSPNSLIRIYPNGNVLYSIRVSATLSCPMDLSFYPHDYQVCSIKLASYGHTTEDLVLVWKEMGPVQVTKNLHLKDFTLIDFKTEDSTSRTNTGEYSSITTRLVFRREFASFLTTVYIPVFFFLLLSYIGLWLKKQNQRLLVTFFALLFMAAFVSKVTEKIPQTSYTKSIDLWTGFTLTFAFLNFLVVVVSSRLSDEVVGDDKNRSAEDGVEVPVADANKNRVQMARQVIQKAVTNVTKPRFEFAAVTGLPVAYLLFALIYYVTQTSEYN